VRRRCASASDSSTRSSMSMTVGGSELREFELQVFAQLFDEPSFR
jgi:hypothetical protein